LNYSLEELCLAGERIINAERIFLNKAGFNRQQDSLPQRMVCHLEEMLTEYYRLRGWDDAGVPKPEKLGTLGLG